MRRLPGSCYFCGDPIVSGSEFCVAHLWAGEGAVNDEIVNSIAHITKEHAYWIERFTPSQIVELANYVRPTTNGAR